jgi:FAD/FMN-containing dehydrogenase
VGICFIAFAVYITYEALKLTREHAVNPDDMRAVLAAGVSRDQIEDALAVCSSR